ncbi:hypothetical protein F4814DRAFT_459685 [Daldinia grandis]|nr:hypothetical protein F4814DRAFT_459685 [Daldinia grandis]
MTSPNESDCSFPSWSTEIIQKVASNLITPSQLLNYACTCKRVSSAIGIREYIINDIQWLQTDKSHNIPFTWTYDKRSNSQNLPHLYPYRKGAQDVFNRPYLQMKPKGSYPPLLNWSIETGVDINVIKEIINAYSRLYPGALGGLWYPMHCTKHDMEEIRRESPIKRDFPSPMLVAAKSGRLDVVKALVESGVEIRKEGIAEYITQYNEGNTATLYELGNIYGRTEIDAFSLACEADEETAQFMILNGLDLRDRDLWWPIEFGRMQVLGTLLQRPFFKAKSPAIIKQLLNTIIGKFNTYPIRDLGVIEYLLDATPSFDRIPWLEVVIIAVLQCRDGTNYRDALAVYLFDLFKNSVTPWIFNTQIARLAARSDNLLEITEAMLEAEDPIKAEGGEGSSWIESIGKEASAYACPRTAKRLLSFGYEFSGASLKQAIQGIATYYTDCNYCDILTYTNQLDMIDFIVDSGVSVDLIVENSGEWENSWEWKNTLLEHALLGLKIRTTKDGRKGLDCRVALRLLHHGADPTEVREEVVDLWLGSAYKDKYLTDYFSYKIPHQNDPANLGREIFSQKISSVDSPLYIDQVYTMAAMMTGKDFLESRLKKEGTKLESMFSNFDSGRVNGFRGTPMDYKWHSLPRVPDEGWEDRLSEELEIGFVLM